VTSTLAAFLARRLLAAALFVVVVSASAFVLVRLAPGDATSDLMLSPGTNAALLAQARERLGLDRPLGALVGEWIWGLAHFDLGESSSFGRPVAALVAERALNTATLAGIALALALAIGLPVGVLTGSRPRGWLAWVVAPVSLALVSCPPLVAALGLLLVAVQTGWLSIEPGRLAIPALALALPLAAALERLQSQATADAIRAPDIGAAAARGIPFRRLLWTHAARQSLRPVLGVFGIVVASLFSGSLAVELVTSWPGLGRLLRDAIVSRDLYLAAGCALVGAVLIAAGNLIADVLRAAADPRVRS
jgi:peptide/nickel transport system permease protein